jgi:hypothetical protein
MALTSEADFGNQVKSQLDAIMQNYQDFIDHMQVQSAEVLLYALEPVGEKSQEYVPYRTGELHDSFYLEASTSRGRATAEIGYARGGNPHYAVFVHENLEMHHRPPTQAKFLQRALEESQELVQARIIEGMKLAAGT